MFQTGQMVMYGAEGVCTVDQVGMLDNPAADSGEEYYTLTPLYHKERIYAPVGTSVPMRPVMTKQEAEDFIEQIPEIDASVVDEPNIRFLAAHYQTLLHSYDRECLVQVIKAVYLKKAESLQKGKKLGQIDERYMKRAEEVLYGELAVALAMDKKDVKSHVESRVEALLTIEDREGNAQAQ